ncbi:MAG TPA: LuxR C-terminal-related transcriptional regulator [Xanthobacteraceae bacterium]|nr:LuxR C-terminal-related transcriptional regulator [Xanthobacteraceae bacterium]
MVTSLNARETQILALLAKGKPVGEIADALEISERTARAHIQMIMDKLGVADGVQAVAVARRDGIVGR